MGILGFTHVGICVSDLERSRRFYQDVFGFAPVSELAIDGGPTEQMMELDDLELRCLFLERDGVRIELMHQQTPGTVGSGEATPMNRRGLTHFAFRVDDLDATLGRIEAAGGRLLEQTRIANPAFQAKVICVLDPDGVRLELVEAPGDPFEPLGTPAGA
ncbi:MAG: VOC family protein [Myxococcota bacterium]|nr:VOC family protein [Myxococcota bacterium]